MTSYNPETEKLANLIVTEALESLQDVLVAPEQTAPRGITIRVAPEPVQETWRQAVRRVLARHGIEKGSADELKLVYVTSWVAQGTLDLGARGTVNFGLGNVNP